MGLTGPSWNATVEPLIIHSLLNTTLKNQTATTRIPQSGLVSLELDVNGCAKNEQPHCTTITTKESWILRIIQMVEISRRQGVLSSAMPFPVDLDLCNNIWLYLSRCHSAKPWGIRVLVMDTNRARLHCPSLQPELNPSLDCIALDLIAVRSSCFFPLIASLTFPTAVCKPRH